MKIEKSPRKQTSLVKANKLQLEITCSEHPDSFFKSTRPVLLLAQFFGHFFVIHGLRGQNQDVKVKWINVKAIYTFYTFIGNVVSLAAAVLPLVLEIFTYDLFYGLFFYCICMAISVYLLRFSLHWSDVCHSFQKMEVMFLRHGFPKHIGLRFKVLLTAFMLAAAVEHFLGVVQAFFRILPCLEDSWSFYSILEAFFRTNYHKLTGFNFYVGFIAFHLNLTFTFTWNFLDIFLGFIAMSISSRFKQFNQFLLRHQWKERSQEFWCRARLEFNCLSTLTKDVDVLIGDLIVLSFINDVFFICLQLFRSLQPRRNWLQKLYSVWSFGFLLGRTLFSSFCLAEVNNCSRKSMTVLFSVPSSSYSKEVKRFILQMNNDIIALTGNRLFSVTRGAILTIAGTIMTYEIVLLQFNTKVTYDNWPTENNTSGCGHLYGTI